MRLLPAALTLAAALALGACDDPAPPSSAPGTATPRPTETSSAAAIDPDYAAFRQRVQAAPGQFIRFQRDFALDAAPGPGAIRATAAQLRDWIAAERQAVGGSDPDACFGDALQLYLEALLRAEEAAGAFEEIADLASLPPDDGVAGDLLRVASDALGEAELANNAALEACR